LPLWCLCHADEVMSRAPCLVMVSNLFDFQVLVVLPTCSSCSLLCVTDYYLFNCTHHYQLMKLVVSHSSSSLLVISKTMVWHLREQLLQGYDCTDCHITFKLSWRFLCNFADIYVLFIAELGDCLLCCRSAMLRRKISGSSWMVSMWVTREQLLRNKQQHSYCFFQTIFS
jgi:hypothetical protein